MNIVIVIAPSFMTVENEEVCAGFSPKPFGLKPDILALNIHGAKAPCNFVFVFKQFNNKAIKQFT